MLKTSRYFWHNIAAQTTALKVLTTSRLEYIMLLNLPIILSSNSLLFYLLFPILFFFILIYSPPRSTIKLLIITNYIIHTQLHCIHWLAWNCSIYKLLIMFQTLLKLLHIYIYIYIYIYSLAMIVFAVKNSQERILFELQQKMTVLQECSWQWLHAHCSKKGTVAASSPL